MTLTIERPKKKRALSVRKHATKSLPLTPTLKQIVENADKFPNRKLTKEEMIELILWLKADLADAAKNAGLK